MRRRPRWRRRIVLLGVALLAAWFGRFAWLRITVRPTPRPEYWEAQLAALDPAPPGGISEAQALALFQSPIWDTDPAIVALTDFNPRQLLFGVWKTARTDTAAASRAFASRLSEQVRQEMLRALEVGWPESPRVDPDAFEASQLQYSKAAFWLLAHARWAREETADPAVAAEDWLGALRMARQFRRHQACIPLLVESILIQVTAQEMMLAAREGVVTRGTRELARQIQGIIGPVRAPRELLAGERLVAQCQLEYVFVREGGQWMDVSELAAWSGTAACAGLARARIQAPSRLWNLASPVFHDLPHAIACLDQRWGDLDEGMDLRACERMRERLEADTYAGVGALNGYPSSEGPACPDSSLVRVLRFHLVGLTSIDAAVTMLALSAYHERTGEYPRALDELVPQYLPRVPIDYADRQPLRYRPTGDSYVLYSIGVDGRDDGGVDTAGGQISFRYATGDVVFSNIRREEPTQ